MCSEPVTENAAARCLLCNVGCPVRIVRSGPDRYIPDYVPHAGYAGLCGRGSVLVEFLDHPQRLLGAERGTGDERRPIDTAAAIQEAAAALRDGGAAIIVDGNLDLDAIAAAGRLAVERGAAWCVFVPPSDLGLVQGLDAAGCEFIGPEGLAAADALLIIGNVFATHPVAAHWVFEARAKSRRMPVLVMADGSGVTAEFATSVFQPRLAAGAAAQAVAAIRTGKTDIAGPDARGLAAWKEPLQKAKSPAIVVSAELGAADAQALGAEVARLAAEVRARVLPLTTYGNAWGALRLAAAGGAQPIEKVLAGAPRTLLVIGADLESALGKRAVGPALERTKRLIYVGPMPNRASRRAGLVLPTAFVFETAGRALLGPGCEVQMGPLLAPPAGVPTIRQILEGLGGPADARADASGKVAAGSAVNGGGEPSGPADGLVLAPAADPFHFADGSLTQLASWPPVVRPRPLLVMAESDARAANLADTGLAVIDGPAGSVEVEAVVSTAERPGQARVSAAFAEVRDVFGWTWDGPRPGEPVRVRVRKA